MAKATLLLVEDDPMLMESMENMIAITFEVEILKAISGLKALEVLKTRAVDVILTDIRMPEMSGLELASILKQKGAIVPIIVCSAYSDRENLLASINLQVFYFLEKPVRPEELFAALRRAIAEAETQFTSKISEFDLSLQQQQILSLLISGLSNGMIGEKVGLSEPTVKYHVGRLFAKFGATTRAELKARVRNGRPLGLRSQQSEN